MIKFLGVVFFCLLVCTTALDYSDLQNTGKACPAQDSCQQRGEKSFNERSCECDEDCRSYLDCCIDGSVSPRPRRSILSCLPYGVENQLGGFGKDYCPSNYTGPEKIKQFCEGQDDFSDPLFSAPVMDAIEGVKYRNYYCAKCHNTSNNFIKFWLISLNFEILPPHLRNNDLVLRNLNYDSHQKKWGVRNGTNFYPCDFFYHMPDFITLARQCRPNLISSCPSTWRNSTVKRACQSYMAVVHTSDKSYKNVHCAICNGEDLESVSCVKSQTIPNYYDFKVLMDFNFHNKTNPQSSLSEKCRRANEANNFAEECRVLDCVLPSNTPLDRAKFQTIMSLTEYLESLDEMNDNCINWRHSKRRNGLNS